MLKLKNFQWLNAPKEFQVNDNQVQLITEANTDLWQQTYYGFKYDNAPMFLTSTKEKYFSFSFKTNTSVANKRFDQTGVVIYQNSKNWFKGSIEAENNEFQRLGSVVTNNAYSDWATTDISVDIKEIYYRLSRRESDYCLEFSEDGKNYKQMRIFHLTEGNEEIRFGIYAASPENSSFKAVFSEFKIEECQWKEHF